MKTRRDDGSVHFSDLKEIEKSPAHYLAAVNRQHESTRHMRVGTVCHEKVLGPRPGKALAHWDGERKGNAYKTFAAEHHDAEIVTTSENDDGTELARAVLADPIFQSLGPFRREAAITWTDAGILCATDGIDMLGTDWLGELKTCRCAQPAAFSRAAASMYYHAQIAFYLGGAVSCGLLSESARALIVAVESTDPYPVTTLSLSSRDLLEGRKLVVKWLERLRQCEAENHWPGYAQSIVPFEMAVWGLDEEEGEEVAAE
jgi:hypothetical protein